MKILTKYVIKELTGPFLFGLFSFISLFLGYLFIDLMRNAQQYNFSMIYILKMVSLRIPEYLVQSAPLAVLLSALLGLGRLTNQSETTAMRAGGMSFARLALPVLIIGGMASVGGILLNEYLVPTSLRTYDAMKKDVSSQRAERPIEHFFWKDFNDKDATVLKTLLYAEKYYPKLQEMQNAVIWEFDHGGRLIQAIEAKTMYWNGQAWVLKKGRIHQYSKDTFYPILVDQGIVYRYTLNLTPNEIEERNIEPDRKSISELSKYIHDFYPKGKSKEQDNERRQLLLELYTKLSIPFAAFVLALLGAPLAIQPQRRSNAAAFGLCIVFIILWYVLMGIGNSIANSGVISPFIGAWLPNIALAAYGLTVFVKVKS